MGLFSYANMRFFLTFSDYPLLPIGMPEWEQTVPTEKEPGALWVKWAEQE
jgi:hypothetical protein